MRFLILFLLAAMAWGQIAIYPPVSEVSYSSLALNSGTSKVGCRLMAPKTGTLKAVGFPLGTVTTGDTLRVSFQDVSATTGVNDGTQDQYRDVVVADSDDNVWKTTGLVTSDGTDSGTKRSVTKNDWLWVHVDYPSYVAGNLQINFPLTSSGAHYSHNLVGQVYTTVGSATRVCSFALQYDDDSYEYIPGVVPIKSFLANTYNSGSASDEFALRASYPFSGTISGGCFYAQFGSDSELTLYDSSSNKLASVSVDKDYDASVTGSSCVTFSTGVSYTANSVIYFGMPTTTTTNSTMYSFTVDTAGLLAAFPGGTSLYMAKRADATYSGNTCSTNCTWTTTTTERPVAWLVFSSITSSSGGGASAHIAQ